MTRRKQILIVNTKKKAGHLTGEGGGGTLLNGLYRYVQPQGVGFRAILVLNRVSIVAILIINSI